jgi:hypothetical protein
VGPKAGMDNVEKRIFLTPPGLELRSLGSPASSQSLYQLSYPGSFYVRNKKENVSHVHVFQTSSYDRFSGYLTSLVQLVRLYSVY